MIKHPKTPILNNDSINTNHRFTSLSIAFPTSHLNYTSVVSCDNVPLFNDSREIPLF